MTTTALSAKVEEMIDTQLPRDFIRAFEQIEPNLSELSLQDAERLREATERIFHMTMVGLDARDRATIARLQQWWLEPKEQKKESRRGLTEMLSGFFGKR